MNVNVMSADSHQVKSSCLLFEVPKTTEKTY